MESIYNRHTYRHLEEKEKGYTMKRIVSTMLVVILIIGLMTGCNDNEISMYKLSNEISLITAMKQEGHIEYSFNFESLLDSTSDTYDQDKAIYDLIQEQIDTLNLNKIITQLQLTKAKV